MAAGHERGRGAPVGYEGPLGATRRELALLPDADGAGRTPVELLVAVNAATDPLLAARARAGVLHRFERFGELAVPFVYHDPALAFFALVVPRARAHEELALRAALLHELARATATPVPGYVLRAATVLGAEGLCEQLTAHRRGRTDEGAAAASAVLSADALMLDEEPAALDADDALEAEEVYDDLEGGEPSALEAHASARGARPTARRAAFAAVLDGEVHLWSAATHAAVLAPEAPLALVVRTDDGALPLALLEVSAPAASPAPATLVARVVLDATRPEDRAVLEALARDARVTLERIDPAGHALGAHRCAGPDGYERELAALLVTLLQRAPGDSDERARVADRWRAQGLDAHLEPAAADEVRAEAPPPRDRRAMNAGPEPT